MSNLGPPASLAPPHTSEPASTTTLCRGPRRVFRSSSNCVRAQPCCLPLLETEVTPFFQWTGAATSTAALLIHCSWTFAKTAPGPSSSVFSTAGVLCGCMLPRLVGPPVVKHLWPKLVCSSCGGVACSSCALEYGRALRTDVAHPPRVGRRS